MKLKLKQNITKFIPPVPGAIKRFIVKKKPQNAMLIHMEMSTGSHDQFIAIIKDNKFRYNKKTYIVDTQYKYPDASSGLWALDYHEELSFPIKRIIKVQKIKKKLKETLGNDIEVRIDPKTLDMFIKSEAIQKTLAGESITKTLKFILAMVIIGILVSLGTLLLLVQQTGILTGGK